MTADKPPRRSLTQNVLWFWLGLLAFAAIGVAGYFAGASAATAGAGLIIGATLMIAATAALGVFAMRRGNIALGSGMFVGYALATIASSGECTLWRPPGADYGFLAGFFIYLFTLGGGLVLLLIVAIAEAVYRSRRGP